MKHFRFVCQCPTFFSISSQDSAIFRMSDLSLNTPAVDDLSSPRTKGQHGSCDDDEPILIKIKRRDKEGMNYQFHVCRQYSTIKHIRVICHDKSRESVSDKDDALLFSRALWFNPLEHKICSVKISWTILLCKGISIL